MILFKVKYKNAKGTEVEVEISLPSLDKILAAQKIGINPNQIVSIKKK